MANFLEKVNYSVMSMPKAMNRTNPTPLDASAVWTSLEDLRNYAQTSAVAYVGQILSLVEYNAETEEISTVKAYIIKDAAGNIEEVGSATNGDNVSIELTDGVLSVKDFGKRYYKYIAAVEGGEAAHYELTEGWVAGLEPKVVEEDGKMVIGWYEPNPTTAEGVKDQVVEVQGEVEQAKEDINALDEILNGTTENPGGLVGEVEDIADVLYGTEGENPVPGLIDQVDAIETNLANNYYTKSETYSKTEVDGLVSGVFHFEGTAESYEALPAENNTKGDVYQVGDKEYAWNGTSWVELGYVVDLSGYYTKSEADAEIKKVQDALDLAEADIAENAKNITTLTTNVGNLQTLTEQHTKDIAGNKALIEGLTAVDGAITLVDNKANQNAVDIGTLNTTVGNLEDLIGAPASEDGATSASGLYRDLEVIQETIEGIVSVGGEANKINQIFAGNTELMPVDKKITIPVYNGTADGLVPVISNLPEGANVADYVLSGAGTWVLAADARIGDLTLNDVQHNTVEEFIAAYVADQQMCWEEI